MSALQRTLSYSQHLFSSSVISQWTNLYFGSSHGVLNPLSQAKSFLRSVFGCIAMNTVNFRAGVMGKTTVPMWRPGTHQGVKLAKLQREIPINRTSKVPRRFTIVSLLESMYSNIFSCILGICFIFHNPCPVSNQ